MSFFSPRKKRTIIKKFYPHDRENHAPRPSGFGVNIVYVGFASQSRAGSNGSEALDAFTCIHADAKTREILRQHTPPGEASDPVRRRLKIGIVRIHKSRGCFPA